jgi:hypothetical protein
MQTKLALVFSDEAGHDPLKAAGLVLAHLPAICKRTRPDVAQPWVLLAVARPHVDPWDQLRRVAKHKNTDADALYRAERLPTTELAA